VIVAPLLVVVVGSLAWAFSGVPDFGDYHGVYGTVLTHVAVSQRHVSNIVAGVVFDYRGLDTMGEEFILFAAASGVALLLRSVPAADDETPRDPVVHDLTRAGGVLVLPVMLLLGLWLVAFGYLTPGGGFQGGVVLAGVVLLVWLATDYREFHELSPPSVVDVVESLGVGSYVAIGIATLGTSGYFLANVLPLGSTNSLTSSGTIALLNWATALEVTGANVLIFREFLKHYRVAASADTP
jgi:multicomponent Na+:H+ antiporter subunit B